MSEVSFACGSVGFCLVLNPGFPKALGAELLAIDVFGGGEHEHDPALNQDPVPTRNTFIQDFAIFVDSLCLPQYAEWRAKVLFFSVIIFTWFFLMGYTLALSVRNNSYIF